MLPTILIAYIKRCIFPVVASLRCHIVYDDDVASINIGHIGARSRNIFRCIMYNDDVFDEKILINFGTHVCS
jgi:hypothetical protein